MDNYALYSQTFNNLPAENIKGLGNPRSFNVSTIEDGSRSHVYLWDDLKITINQMPANKISEHLGGFIGYVKHLSDLKNVSVDRALVDRISKTKMVLGVIVEPGVDEQGRAEEVIGAITYNTDALMFFSDGVYDQNANLIIGP